MRALSCSPKSYALKKTFKIARGQRSHADVVECEISDGGFVGRGECTPYPRYGESVDSVMAQIQSCREKVGKGLSREDLLNELAPGAARNAIDSALWDLESHQSNRPIWDLAGLEKPNSIQTAYTLSIQEPERMVKEARLLDFPLLKLKCAGDGHDKDRILAVREACPDKKIIIDANESWDEGCAKELFSVCEKAKVLMIEQPFPVGKESFLKDIKTSCILCADESCHTNADLDRCAPYDMVNIKLDKTGGLTHALELMTDAKAVGFKVMIGCMLGSALAIRLAFYLGQSADIVDIDAPLLLREVNSYCDYAIQKGGRVVVC
ncbi:dipeptide epimerase [Candidatus Marinamargulisbacteria bacterium SCGC AG-439-L15]|nr:dipeptide epimerase [Candidatus Marinamargulisbacteria bacterium SCGC AG-439-L15]